jgi:plastocyanin
MITRRILLQSSACAFAGLALPAHVRSATEQNVVTIRMWGSQDGSHVAFDPIGLLVQPGQIIRWLLDSSVHTTTAYHPDNGGRSLRIPKGAKPWDSGYLVNPGEHFDVTLTVEGVYDYFCLPHEQAGMVGRIIVGKPDGPGALPFDYFKADPATAKWLPVPAAAARAFPSIDDMMRHKRVPAETNNS